MPSTRDKIIADYVLKWDSDTRCLSLLAAGAWTRLVCHLERTTSRGQDSRPWSSWASLLRTDEATTKAALRELVRENIAKVDLPSNGSVTISCAWILAEEQTRAATRVRVQRHRARKAGNEEVTQPAISWDPVAGWQNITDEDKARWKAGYPAIDIDQKLAALHAWLHANPLKVKSNWERFITNCLRGDQDRGGDLFKSNRPAEGIPRAADGGTIADQLKRLKEQRT